MKQLSLLKYILITLIATSIYSCIKVETLPNEPQIAFIRAETSTTVDALDAITQRLVLYLSLTDGNGDFGLNDADSLPPFNTNNKNCFAQLYYKKDNHWLAGDSINLPQTRFRIPYIGASNAQPSVVKAEIQLTFDYPATAYTFDSVYYRISVCDRAFNYSNTLETPHLSIKKRKNTSSQPIQNAMNNRFLKKLITNQ